QRDKFRQTAHIFFFKKKFYIMDILTLVIFLGVILALWFFRDKFRRNKSDPSKALTTKQIKTAEFHKRKQAQQEAKDKHQIETQVKAIDSVFDTSSGKDQQEEKKCLDHPVNKKWWSVTKKKATLDSLRGDLKKIETHLLSQQLSVITTHKIM